MNTTNDRDIGVSERAPEWAEEPGFTPAEIEDLDRFWMRSAGDRDEIRVAASNVRGSGERPLTGVAEEGA